MLQAHRISSARHRAGLRLAALSILVAGFGGYALRAGAKAPVAPDGDSVRTAVDVRVNDGAPIHVLLLTRTGEKAIVREEPDARNALAAPLEIAYTATRLDGDRLQLDTTLRQGEPLAKLGSPRLITRNGEAASIRVKSDDGAHEVAITLLPRLVATQTALPPLPPLRKMSGAMAPLQATPATNGLPPLPATPPLSALPAPPATDALPPPPADQPPPPPQRAL